MDIRKREKRRGTKGVVDIVVRYVILLVLGMFMNVFYVMFKPLTIYPVYYILGLFFNASLSRRIISVEGINFEIIDACVAGSAFLLLTALNLMAGKMGFGKRVYALFFSYISLLVLNILRIVLLAILAVNSSFVFSVVHMAFFYVISILFVFAVWIAEIRIFRIKEIPLYSDIKYLLNFIKK